MMLSTKEKEGVVIDLLNKGYTVREIAKLAHVSFTFIKKSFFQVIDFPLFLITHCNNPYT
ncbi:MAG: hypothetical protein WKF36_06500 [Candidatus Nitrosocosmicus sp.]